MEQLCSHGTDFHEIWYLNIFRKYRVIQKDGLNFVCLYFLNYTWYVNDLHKI